MKYAGQGSIPGFEFFRRLVMRSFLGVNIKIFVTFYRILRNMEDWLPVCGGKSCIQLYNKCTFLLAPLKSAYPLIWGAHQFWGNVLAVL